MRAILTDEHHRQIIEAERGLDDAIEIMDGLEDCGSDCKQLRAVAAELKDRFQRIKKNFITPKRKSKGNALLRSS